MAEVLITLGVIGVVAALSIPALISATQESEYKNAYKKAFSVASQAWMSVESANDSLDLPQAVNNKTERLTNFSAFQSRFKVVKSCWNNVSLATADISQCWAQGDKWYGYPTEEDGAAFIDNSGFAWVLIVSGDAAQVNDVLVDINGSKKPNKLGQDRFLISFLSSENVWYGHLIKVAPPKDCLSPGDCAPGSYENTCPSVQTHPCYFSSWLLN